MLTKTHNFRLVNLDTDSISFCKQDGSEFAPEEAGALLAEINSFIPEKIQFEDDGIFSRVVVLKAKNYILLKKNKKTGKEELSLKGSSLKDAKKEPILRKFMDEVISALIYETGTVPVIYERYCNEARNITDISRWAVKKSISKKLLEGKRKQETDVLTAIGDLSQVREGDKVYLYNSPQIFVPEFDENGEPILYKSGKNKGQQKGKWEKTLKLTKNWDGQYDKQHYLFRVHATLSIFEEVLDMKQFQCYSE